MALSEQEKMFATEYVRLGCGTGDAVQAALNAGYAQSTARFASQWINENNQHKPTAKYKADLHAYIKELQATKLNKSIKGIEEIQLWWSDNVSNEELDMRDRMKSSELLVRSQGGFVDKVQAEVTNAVSINIELSDD